MLSWSPLDWRQSQTNSIPRQLEEEIKKIFLGVLAVFVGMSTLSAWHRPNTSSWKLRSRFFFLGVHKVHSKRQFDKILNVNISILVCVAHGSSWSISC